MPKFKLCIDADLQKVNVDVAAQALGRSVQASLRYGRSTADITREQPTKTNRLPGSEPGDEMA